MSSSQVPIGWENRTNCMSEKDMKLGGIAATKFIDKSLSANAYTEDASGVYQTSDAVREHYLRQIEHQQQQQQQPQQMPAQNKNDDSPFASGNRNGHQSSTPEFWEERQQRRQLEAEGLRNQDTKIEGGVVLSAPRALPGGGTPIQASPGSSSKTSARVALVGVATNALESLADVLEHDNKADIPMEDRAAFAKAVQRAMQALAAAKN